MARKPNRMYREIRGQVYTRREYMGGVPGSRLLQFDMGSRPEQFPVMVTLHVKEACQIRHTALEAGRIAANRVLQKKIGSNGFHLKVRVFPHAVLRENKTATGAGADRISDGMRRAFGKPVGTAARVQADQAIYSVWTSPSHFLIAKDALQRAGHKMPSPIRISVDKGEELLT